MKVGVIVFPGSNGDADAKYAVDHVLGEQAAFIWHKEESVAGFDALVLPGGFSYGDHLRAGAIARFSPIMAAVRRFAEAGGPVLGICNGFQILTEAGLLPGVLRRNASLRFQCEWVHVRVDEAARATPFTVGLERGRIYRLPIAHGDGSYYASPAQLASLEASGQAVLRYCDEGGAAVEVNGSVGGVAGVCNERGNVFGLMPHPERATETVLGGADGLPFFASLRASFGEVR